MENKFFSQVANGQMILSDNNGEILKFPFTGENSPKREISFEDYWAEVLGRIYSLWQDHKENSGGESLYSFSHGYQKAMADMGKPVPPSGQ